MMSSYSVATAGVVLIISIHWNRC